MDVGILGGGGGFGVVVSRKSVLDDPCHGFLWFIERGFSGGIGLGELILESCLLSFELGDLQDHLPVLSERDFQGFLEVGVGRLCFIMHLRYLGRKVCTSLDLG